MSHLTRAHVTRVMFRYCDKSSPGPVVSPKGTVGLEMHLHTDSEGVFSGFKGRYQFMQAKNEFGDCGGNISNSENGVIKSPNYPEKYSTNDPSMYTAYHVFCIMYCLS